MPSGSAAALPSPSPAPLPQLPRGGRTVFPRYQVVAYYGTAGSGALGVLGATDPATAARRLQRQADAWSAAAGRPVLPALELITTVALGSPGPEGTYSRLLPDAQVQQYLDVARRNRMLLLLDFQPGRADFLSQVQRYARFLRQPEVGVALDPEWQLEPGQLPDRQIGRTTAARVNAVSAYVEGVRARYRLPQKVFLLHQFKPYQVPDRAAIALRPGLATVLHVDGFGTPAEKRHAYGVIADATQRLHPGFKLFYKADVGLMTPAQVLALSPRPELVSYQ